MAIRSIACITWVDPETHDDSVVIVSQGGSHIKLCISMEKNGEFEAFIGIEQARRLATAIAQNGLSTTVVGYNPEYEGDVKVTISHLRNGVGLRVAVRDYGEREERPAEEGIARFAAALDKAIKYATDDQLIE